MSRKIKDVPTSPLLENATDNNVGTKLGTNLASLGTDCISREQAINALSTITMYKGSIPFNTAVMRIEQLPPIQPDNGLQKLAGEIASFKRHVKSENSDYLTGYLSALSVVEGMIADMREVTE